MPTYDYVCADCGHVFEEFQSITAKVLTTCPECGGTISRKIGAGAGLVFKGSGFYITDYKNKKKPHNKSKSSKESSNKIPEKAN